MENPIFLSLDVDSWGEAHELAQTLRAEVGGYKIGPRLAIKATSKDWQKLSDCGPVFYDPKYYDIPNTMVESIKACVDLGVSYITVHASAGREALSKVKTLEDQINASHFFKTLAVTALTSFGSENPMPGFQNKNMKQVVSDLADLVVDCGLSGLVCSGEEVDLVTNNHKDLFVVVPGIRLPGSESDDQKRVMTPDVALSKGAKALVIGRPIIQADDPLQAAMKFKALCQS